MDGIWKYYEGKRVYIILKNKRNYQGTVVEIETTEGSPLTWMIVIDKFGNRITFCTDEIDVIQEEKE
jgi:ribosomal protein S4E